MANKSLQFLRNAALYADKDAAMVALEAKLATVSVGQPVLAMYGTEGNVKTLLGIGGTKTMISDTTEVDSAIKDAIDSIKGEGVSEGFDTLKEVEDLIKGIWGGAGFDENGVYVAPVGDTILKDSTSLADADKKLADAIRDLTTKVNKNHVEAADKSIVVDATAADKTTIKVNVKAGENALKLDAANGLYVDQSALTSYEGKEAIEVGDKSAGVKEVSLKIATADKVLKQDVNGLLANIALNWDPAKGLDLVGKDGVVINHIDASDFVKDGMLQAVELVVDPEGQAEGTYLKFTFNADAGDTVIFVNVTDLIDIYKGANGVVLKNDNTFEVQIDPETEGFLTTGKDGVKLSGVQDAIEDAAKAAKTTVSSTDTFVTVTASAPALDGHIDYVITTTDVASASALTAEVTRATKAEDKIEGSVGLAADGSHVKTTGNYTKDATTIAGEIAALDTALKGVADAARKVAKGNGIEIATTGVVDTIAAKVKTNDPVIEVTAEGIKTKDDAVYDCGTY